MEAVVFIVIALVLYGAFHGHHVRRNYRRGLGLWISMRGPFNTRISKRL